MGLLKKKKNNRSASPVRFQKKKGANGSTANKRRKSLGLNTFFGKSLKYMALMSVPFLLLGMLYLGSKFVIQIRNNTTQEVAGVSFANGEVLGFSGIPVYPGSEFIFENHMEDEIVKDMLSNGKSVYRLPPNVSDIAVYEYYAEALSALDWEYIQSVPRTDEEKKNGEYWNKDEIGLRIYSNLNDIWFQKITIEEANSGLSEIVASETERELILSASQGTDLLPDYPWILAVPAEYIVRYYATEYEDLRGIEFQKLGSNESIFMEPIGLADGTPFDTYFKEFLNTYNENKLKVFNKNLENGYVNEDDKPLEWNTISSAYTTVNDRATLVTEISNGLESSVAYSFPNYKKNQVYVVCAFEEDNHFVNFILDNIEEKRKSYTQEDFTYE